MKKTGFLARIAVLVAAAVVLSLLAIGWAFLRPVPPAGALISPAGTEIGFILLGDQGTRNLRQWVVARDVRRAAADESIAAVFLLGDSFYPKGVQSTDDLRWRYALENMYRGGRLNRLPFYAVLGNHDVQGDPGAYLEYAARKLGSGRWQMPARNYWQDFGRDPLCAECPLVRVAFLDTTGDLNQLPGFLEDTFEHSTATWRVVAAHHPIRNFGRYRDKTEVATALARSMRHHKIHLYASGHDHNQQLIWSPGETVFLISGNGGKRGYTIDCSDAALLFCNEDNGFSEAHFSGKRMILSLHGRGDAPERHTWHARNGGMPKRL